MFTHELFKSFGFPSVRRPKLRSSIAKIQATPPVPMSELLYMRIVLNNRTIRVAVEAVTQGCGTDSASG